MRIRMLIVGMLGAMYVLGWFALRAHIGNSCVTHMTETIMKTINKLEEKMAFWQNLPNRTSLSLKVLLPLRCM